MTYKFENVYLVDTATVCGPYEKMGPLKRYFDKTYNDLYFGEKSFEKAEIKSVREAINVLLKKVGLTGGEIDLVVGGDLLNQIAASTYGSINCGKGFIGVYGACSTIAMAIIVAGSLVNTKMINNAVCVTSSHNMGSEKQFRNRTEYGAPKPDTATFTATGGAACLLAREKSDIKVEDVTIGKIIDYEENDPNHMGRVMAPAAIDTLLNHFKETGRKPEYYDLIVTGDLGIYGKEIVVEALEKEGYSLDNYDDCGTMLYDLGRQKDVKAGGSGPVCSALVTFGYIFDQLKKKKLKKVLVVPTGALFSPTLIYQKENINSIAHAISLEAV